MDDIIKEKIDNLKQLRNNYFNAIIIVSGGIVWLCFIEPLFYLRLFFILLGLYINCIYILRYNDFNLQIEKLLRGCYDNK